MPERVDSRAVKRVLWLAEFLSILGVISAVALLLAYHGRVPETFASHYTDAGVADKWDKREATDLYPVVSAVFYALVFLPQTLYFIYRKKRPPATASEGKDVDTNRILVGFLKVAMVWYSTATEWGRLRIAVGEAVSYRTQVGRALEFLVLLIFLVIVFYNLLPAGKAVKTEGGCP